MFLALLHSFCHYVDASCWRAERHASLPISTITTALSLYVGRSCGLTTRAPGTVPLVFFAMLLTFCVISLANIQAFTGYAPILAKIRETDYHRLASTNIELKSAERIAIVQYFDRAITPGFAAARQLMCDYAELHGLRDLLFQRDYCASEY